MYERNLLGNEKDPYEKRQRDLRSFESPGALPGWKSTRLAIRNHGNRPSSPLLRCAIRTTQSSPESAPYNKRESDGGKTTRIMCKLGIKQILHEFIYVDYDYTTGG